VDQQEIIWPSDGALSRLPPKTVPSAGAVLLSGLIHIIQSVDIRKL